MKTTLSALSIYLGDFASGTDILDPFTVTIAEAGLNAEAAPALRKHVDLPLTFMILKDGQHFVGDMVLTVEAAKELDVMQTPSIFVNIIVPLLELMKVGKLISGNSNHSSGMQLDLKVLPGVHEASTKVQVCVKGFRLDHLRNKR